MKKLLILGIAAMVFHSANAQVGFGITAGGSLANFSGSDVSDAKSKFGFFAGVAADANLGFGLHLKPSLIYSQQGAKEDASVGTASISADYLNLPVLVAYQFHNGVFVETGPQIGFLLSADASSNGVSASVKDQFKKTDFSWDFGLGYKIMPSLSIDLRYDLGLSKVPNDGTSKAYNSVFQLGLAYYFHK